MNENRIKILAISGSLRSNSSNTALVRAIANLSPKNIEFTIYNGLGDLPHFNPDIDIDDNEPPAVKDLRTQLKEADGVLLCTPEYANGVPGVLKNALDWIVSSGEFVNKPVAVISASPHPLGGEKAHASLLLTLNMVSAEVVEGGTLIIPFINLKLKEGVMDPGTAEDLKSVLHALIQAIRVH
ncbi:NAD(P)H-dependent FMN reductase [Aneurinibacillus soli]|uniref:NADPH azoreductase n=1 Tax=Aneurinibacillus soli TaxID=1500254 RepID=A0A0U5BC52_9BACL|nr:NAD(P)H-dependent oxidoreductase [Aneurinibacillus soli]PYE61404.1 NAD(P)H-dependent FMN reductase [Aneurinibacillus soli]BAU27767.1 NADPH azoreductase [Aneurinibacillus soli]